MHRLPWTLQVNPLRVKKLHLLAALEVDKFKRKTLDLGAPNAAPTTTAAGRTAQQPTATMQHTAAQTLASECLATLGHTAARWP